MTADLTQHHPTCARETAEEAAAYAAWTAQWPNACQHCDGHGGFAFGDRHADPNSWIDCPSCITEGHCPRCARPMTLGDAVCGACGWTGRDPEDIAPSVTVCSGDCWDRYTQNV